MQSRPSSTYVFLLSQKKMQGCTIIVSKMVENRLATNMKQASLKDFLGKNFKRNIIDYKQSNIFYFFFFFFFFQFLSYFFSFSNGSILTKYCISGTFNNRNHFLRSFTELTVYVKNKHKGNKTKTKSSKPKLLKTLNMNQGSWFTDFFRGWSLQNADFRNKQKLVTMGEVFSFCN